MMAYTNAEFAVACAAREVGFDLFEAKVIEGVTYVYHGSVLVSQILVRQRDLRRSVVPLGQYGSCA